jgi:O-methyltransferase
MKWIERSVKVAFNKLGLEISRIPKKRVIDYWNEDEQFVALAKQVRGHTLIHEERLFMLYQFANSVVSLKGNVAELGVYKGGSAKLLAKIFERSTEKKGIFLFDTFCGMPEANPLIDLHKKGDFPDTSLESVQNFLSDCQNITVYEGLFSDTLVKVANETFCFVHIDCDIYQSVLECCEFFYPRVTPGGVMIFDDYGSLSCPGAKKAVDDYFLGKIGRPIYLPTGQCVITKHV